jgi:hypothetical protein
MRIAKERTSVRQVDLLAALAERAASQPWRGEMPSSQAGRPSKTRV